MSTILAWLWMGLIFASAIWYTWLLFYVGIKGGKEIISLARSRADDPERR